MTPFVMFSLALRIIGAWVTFSAVEYFLTSFNMTHGLYTSASTQVMAIVNQAVLHLLVGFVLIKFAPFLASLVYPAEASCQPSVESSEETE
ncbi:hypothetical protein [Dyella tabacisoli]|uniref:Uncharacterized protein n=1 Tax=Dyella tabacisoli TaxID=2282381 RepID=A0A369UID1_9GAMM|nr:hypothetical protein [Dyella tabacisoli]RDD80257.1 hypothetical protein DVJ77_18300 [Dyella tabacisoli]